MGTIAEKLSYLDETREQILTNIQALGGDLTEESTFRSYADALDEVWEEQDHVTGTGTELSLSTKKGKMKVELLGNTSQANTILPSTYTQVEYIQSSGLQYINTGFEITSVSQAYSVELDMQYTQASTGNEIFVSAGSDVNVWVGQSSGYYGLGNAFKTSVASTQRATLKVSFGTSSVLRIGNEEVTRPISTNTGEIRLFGVSPYGSSAKLYRAKIYNASNVLVRDLVPCFRNSDNVIGMYDLVNNLFYTNAGTGTFTKGDNSTLPNPTYPQDIHIVSGDNTIVSTGKNILNFDDFLNYSNVIYTKNGGTYNITDRGNIISNRYPLNLLPNTTYTLSCEETTNNVSALRVQIYEGGTYLTRVLATGSSEKSATFTTNNSSNYYMNMTFSGDVSYPLVWKNVQLELGNQATTYQAFQGKSEYQVNLGVENLAKPTFDKPWGISGSGNTRTITTNSAYKNRAQVVKVKSNTTYTCSGDFSIMTNNYIRISSFDSEPQVGSTSTKYDFGASPFTFTTDTNTQYIVLYNSENVDTIVDDIQLEEGSKANTYTPYGTTPIELCKIGTYQDRFIRNSGNNLFSGDYSQFDSQGGEGTTYGYFKLPDDGERYALSVIAKKDFTATLSQYIGFTKKGGTATGGFWWLIQGNQTYTKGQKYTIHNSLQGTRLDYVSIYANNSTTLEQLMDNFYIQLEKSSEATDYEPYGNGDWYLEKKIGKVIFNGTTILDVTTSSGTLKGLYRSNYPSDKIYQGNQGLYFERATFLPVNTSATRKENTIYENQSNAVVIGSATDTLETLQAKFNGGLMYYILATPTYTKIEGTLEGQLEDVWRANSYEEQTNVSQENNDLPFVISAKALGIETEVGTLSLNSLNTMSLNPRLDTETVEPTVEEQEESIEEEEEE